jgi:hypothetical protein
MNENTEIILVGCAVVVGGFIYTGSYNRAFGRGQPDYPPTLQGRITLWACGALFICVGIIRIITGY